MEKKEELTLAEARTELEKWQEILDVWPQLSSAEKFSHYYQVSQISAPFVDEGMKFRDNSQLTDEEKEWNAIMVDLVYFRRNLEKLWKVREESDMKEVIEKAKSILENLLEEYDDYMAGE